MACLLSKVATVLIFCSPLLQGVCLLFLGWTSIYSVVTGSSTPVTMFSRACQARVAHLTRLGKALTLASISRRPRPLDWARPVTRSIKCRSCFLAWAQEWFSWHSHLLH